MTLTMKAIVLHATGGPEVLRIEERPVPELKPGTAILRIAAFGLNRSELFTRQGHSPDVSLPRILGIEAVGEILEADGVFAAGDRVATVMGGMDGPSTAPMQNMRAYRSRRSARFRRTCRGPYWAPCPRCSKRLGARCFRRLSFRRVSVF